MNRAPELPVHSSAEKAPSASVPAKTKKSLPIITKPTFAKRSNAESTTAPSAPPVPTAAPAAGSTGTSTVSVSSVAAAVRKHYCALLLILLAAALGVWIWGVSLSGRATGCKATVTGIALIVSHITLGTTLLAAVALLIAKRRGWGAQSSTVLRVRKVAVGAALMLATAIIG
jgi:hypothetical protein